MKIKKIKINNYGILKQKEINLENNINIIYGKNETGKSTLLNYVNNIFYGISKNKNGKDISDYEKYLPWTGDEFSGKISYELDNNESYEVYRDFNKKNPTIVNSKFEDISNQFKIDKKDGNQFFYEQTGLDQNTYLSTIMSTQQEVVLDNQSQSILVQKLANIAGTGEDKVSFQKAMDKLNKRLVEEVGTNRTQDRPLNIVQSMIKKIDDDLKTKNNLAEEKETLEHNKVNLKEKLNDEENKNNQLSKLNMLTSKYAIELEKNELKNKMKVETEQKIKNKEQEKENYVNQNEKNSNINFNENKKIKNNYLIFGIIFILLIILNLINFNLIKNKLINYLILILIPIEIIIFIFNLIKNKKIKNKINKQNIENEKIKNELKEKITILNSEIKLLEENNEKLQKEIDTEKENILFKFNLEKNDILKESNINFNIEDKNKIEKELEYSNQKIIEYKLKLNSIEYEENNINNKMEDFIIKEVQYTNLQEQLNELMQKNKNILDTKEILEKAYEKMKNNVTPKFTQNLSNIVSNISNGKYKKVIFNEEKGLIVELENGDYISANRLSVGTIDELYLSLRLSMLDEISEEKMPIILDEAFAYFDDERLKNCLEFLTEKAKNHQIIILSCSSREKQIIDSMNIQYNFIEL